MICRCIIVIFFSDTSLCARIFIRNVRGGGHNSTVGVTLPEVWARSVQCVARGKPSKLFGLGHGEGRYPGFRNIPGDGVSASPRGLGLRIPVMQTPRKMCTSCARLSPRGKHYFSFLPSHEHSHEHSQHAESTCKKNAAQQHQQATSCVCGTHIHLHRSAAASCFFRGLFRICNR